MNRLWINTSPSCEQFEKVHALLSKEEGRKFSFLHNWEFIKNDYAKGRFFALMADDEPIGFRTWSECEYDDPEEKSIGFEKIWLDELYRGNGLAQIYQRQTIDYFQRRGAKLIDLEAATEEGARLSKRMGFLPYEHEYSDDEKRWYLPLPPYAPVKYCGEEEVSVLKYGPSLRVENNNNRISLLQDFVSNPMMVDIPPKWTVEIIINGETRMCDKSKYLFPKLGIRTIGSRFVMLDKEIIQIVKC